jgi:hypothetical protein
MRLPEFQENQNIKVTRFSALFTGRLYLPRDTLGTHICLRLSRTQDHIAVESIIIIIIIIIIHNNFY